MNPNGPVPAIAGAFSGIQFNGGELTLASVTDVQTVLEVLQAEAPVPFAKLPKNRNGLISANGFWSLKNPALPPLPGNLMGLDAWSLGNGNYILDDRQVDDAEQTAEARLDAAGTMTLGGSPLMRMSMMSSLSSTYAYGNPVYLTNMVVSTSGGLTASFSIAGGTNNVPYDIQSTTDLLGNWQWLGIGYTSNTYVLRPLQNDFERII
jgi:hypothetical protein